MNISRMRLTESTLGAVCSLVTDGTHDTPRRTDSGYPLIKAKEIVGGTIDFDTCDQISERDHLRVVARSKPEKGDTLFAHIGASLGEAAYVSTSREFSIKNIALFKPNPSIIDGRYLYYLVIGTHFQDTIKAARTGSAQPFLSLGHLRPHSIRLHSDIEEQRRIASILSAYDNLIENNTRRIAVLEEMARRIFEEWFVHFRAPGCENLPRIDTPLGPVPEGWHTAKLEELASDIRDSVLPSEIETTTPYVGLEHIPRRSITLREWGNAGEVGSLKLAFKTGDFLFGKIRPYFHKAAMAPIDGVSSSDAIVIRAKHVKWRGVVGCVVSSDTFVAHAVKTSNGTKMPRADWKVLRNHIVAMPPDALLVRFNEAVLQCFALASNLAIQNRNLRAQRDLLLPKLISGEIDVSETSAILEAAE